MGLPASDTAVMQAISRNIPTHVLKLCKDPSLPNELLAMEERQVIRSYKFGVSYLAPNQSTEDEMLQNKHGIIIFLFIYSFFFFIDLFHDITFSPSSFT